MLHEIYYLNRDIFKTLQLISSSLLIEDRLKQLFQNICLIDALSIARDIASGLEFLHEAKKINNNQQLRVPGKK